MYKAIGRDRHPLGRGGNVPKTRVPEVQGDVDIAGYTQTLDVHGDANPLGADSLHIGPPQQAVGDAHICPMT